MRIFERYLMGILLSLMLASPVLAGEQHVVDGHQLAAIMAEREAQQSRDRAAIHETLARPEVRQVAKNFGADMDRLNAAVDVLGGRDLERAAAAARQVDSHLVGGGTVTISTTTIIIALLVLILLIVALR